MTLHLTRRRLIALASLGAPLALQRAHAHHGWSSFDQDRPIYLEGRVVESRWRNPHAELVVETPATPALPADLRQRTLPAQSAGIDGAALLAKAALPTRTDRRWELELAPLTRMRAWQVEEIRHGAQVAAVGFTFQGEKGEAVMRVEYLFVAGKTYGLRSSPA
ncbi:DUF6152 family protein [Pseudorhodoferax sp. Leaf274]|uniref:DUF6152 family protein n=1 Tax=Pseudorhodoferax sp. Leaf274 TaxID=1736318 RepID=UPI000702C725|nr:DUF6152 family protein [Pseudorhodoferax sp. Leaf274]KQP43293.1 hypothetical protein ASF44_06935 [Pseudorhodoferax sp. Leaf274]